MKKKGGTLANKRHEISEKRFELKYGEGLTTTAPPPDFIVDFALRVLGKR